MSDKSSILIASLVRIAREDLDGARLLASRNNRNAIYLCEQAAEKIIRAILTSEGVHAGIRHSLRQMVDEGVPDANPLKTQLAEIAVLEDYATAFRYPTPAGRVPAAPVGTKFAVLADKVAVILDEVVTRFDIDLTARDQAARKPGPFR